jgi:hypothetical protein
MTNILNLFKFIAKKEPQYKVPFGLELKQKIKDTPELVTDDDWRTAGGDIDISYSKITSLPDNLTVNGYLNCYGTQITSLPDNLTVNGNLNLGNTPIRSLPNNLTVRGILTCGSKIEVLPNNLTVSLGYLDLRNTVLARIYTRDQIRQKLEAAGGTIDVEIEI